ncbi:hypothetical protein ACFOQM_07400 [Paenibacillus sp. GCM10012307]|uniref:Uncharacterized protein n=1 Tax=Paenibacillus roseus TaxID=2798579 RepID=A0A934MPQ5_9BACL|nr:hypothetical protein [Paenibacillus roseus]MBJ6361118.1 hypothetical protein [Paenibacillus roseus]
MRKRQELEKAVERQAAPLQPFKARQIVLALEDMEYRQLLQYDERGELDPASVNRALKQMAAQEPNLFYTPEAARDLNDASLQSKAAGASASAVIPRSQKKT